MVKHIVFFKLTSVLNNDDKGIQLNQMKEAFSILPLQLKYISDFRTGYNFTIADHAWDFVIDSSFANRDDLQKYQDSMEHQEAIQRAAHIRKTKAVIDYEY
jgi:hypothetical protein